VIDNLEGDCDLGYSQNQVGHLGFSVDRLYELRVQCGSSGVWLVKFGDLEISSISSFETRGWRRIGNWPLGLASA
jgi:hypothetical protein